ALGRPLALPELTFVATKVALLSLLSSTRVPYIRLPEPSLSVRLAGVRVAPEVVVTYRCSGVGLNSRLNVATNPVGVFVTLATASCGSVMFTVAAAGVPRAVPVLGFSRFTVKLWVPAYGVPV